MNPVMRQYRPPALSLVVLGTLGIAFLLADARPTAEAGAGEDWRVEEVLDEMIRASRWPGPLRVAATPWRIRINMEVLHFAALTRRRPLDRIHLAGEPHQTLERMEQAEFILTSDRNREFAGDLAWQAFVRNTLEAGRDPVAQRFAPIARYALPDGSRLTLWQQRETP